jgi:hypothetical protein
MAQYKVKKGQNIFDVAIDISGSIEGLFDLLAENDWLSMTTELTEGMQLEYSEGYVVNSDIVAAIHNTLATTPINGTRNIYYSECQESLLAIIRTTKIEYAVIALAGEGQLSILWGDETNLEEYKLTESGVQCEHYYNTDGNYIIRIYGSPNLIKLNTTDIIGDIYITQPLVVDEYTNHNGNSLSSLFLFKDTYKVDLSDSVISDLSPLINLNLQELDLRGVTFKTEDVLTIYLKKLVSEHGDRVGCTVYLSQQPSTEGMEAINTLLNEPEWNSKRPWKFIISDTDNEEV